MEPKQYFLIAACLIVASAASAAIAIDTVFVGNAGNANDSTGYGAVSYDYHIGTYAVTNAQYTAFLNAVAANDTHGLYNVDMGSNVHGGISRSGDPGSYTYGVRTATSGPNSGQSMGNMPVNFVSFWDAARFANWLTNGQPTGAQGSGTTETGVYNLNGVTNPVNNTITRNAAAWNAGGVAIASENEWYKAAYYSGSPTGADGEGYWLYPTQSNTAPTATGPNGDDVNSANYGNAVATVSEVGGYVLVASNYGTFDQAGNVWELNDDLFSTSERGIRGGAFNFNASALQSANRLGSDPTIEFTNLGFRVTSLAPIPEPSTYAAMFGVLAGLIVLWRRKGRS